MDSSGQNRWIYCPLVPEGSIKFSVMPSGKNLSLNGHNTQHSGHIWVNKFQNELKVEIYSKGLGRAIGKVVCISFS